MIIVTTLFLLPPLLYAAVLIIGARAQRTAAAVAASTPGRGAAPRPDVNATGAGRLPGTSPPLRMLLAAGLVLHALTFFLPWQPGLFYYGFAKLMSATVWFGLLMLWLDSFELDARRMLLVAMPLAIVVVPLPMGWPGTAFSLGTERPLFLPHLLAGTLAYGMMFLAALHALMMALVERRLHPRSARMLGPLAHALLGNADQLPPLMTLERTLFRFVGLGFVFLLLTTLTGILFSEETFGRPLRLEQKTVFSLIATLIFGLLLLGRHLWGWRGRTALRLSGWGFVLLLLSYVGSRFVLEVILQTGP